VETARRSAWAAIASECLMLYLEMHDWRSGPKLSSRIRPDFLSTAGNRLGQEMRGSV